MIRVRVEAAMPVLHAGLAALIGEQPDLTVLGPQTSPSEASFDVLVTSVVDPFGPDSRSEELGGAPIVWLTDDEAAWTRRRWRDGLRAVLAPSAPPTEILAAIRAVAAGLVAASSDVLLELLPEDASSRAHELPDLTTREAEVLQLLSAGLGNKGIARRLGISEHTVKTHVASILHKLGAATRTEAVAIGVRMGLILL